MHVRGNGLKCKRLALLCLTSAMIVGGCSFMDLTKEGEGVRVATADAVAACTGLGRTTASVVAEVASIPRHPDAVKENIEVTARNSAASMGGDTIVPASPIAEGKQTFEVYRCKR
jgi:hypothetical protein